MICNLIKPALR